MMVRGVANILEVGVTRSKCADATIPLSVRCELWSSSSSDRLAMSSCMTGAVSPFRLDILASHELREVYFGLVVFNFELCIDHFITMFALPDWVVDCKRSTVDVHLCE